MNKNNENLNLQQSFFGCNLYSSSFSSSPKNISNQKQLLEKKSLKNTNSVIENKNQGHKRYNSETYNNYKSNNNSSNIYFTSLLSKNPEEIILEQTPTPIPNRESSPPQENMKVMVRIRPPLPREIEFDIPFRSITEVTSDNKMVIIYEYLGSSTDEIFRQHEFIQNPSMFQQHRFTFDHIFDQESTQLEIYLKAAQPSVKSLLEGYNSTILAYGQTGTGKTYTMEGFTLVPCDDKRGMVPRVVEEIFLYINNKEKNNNDIKFSIRTSYLQIYNEYISDLLIPEKKNLNIRENKKRGIYVDGLSEWIVKNPNEIYTLLGKGTDNRAISSTTMNEISSRSHAIFVITLEQEIQEENNIIKKIVSKLNLVDLAGSERTRITGAKGKQLEESKKINKSLSALGNVINALTDPKGNTYHIPYRDSKLTRLLEDSLGGNCITTLITMISPCQNFINETLSSLCFAKRAKKIKNKPKINQKISHQGLIKQYEIIVRNMKKELAKKDELLNDNKLLKQIEQLNDDKNHVMKQLEIMEQNYLKEKEEKKILKKSFDIIKKENDKNENLVMNLEKTPQFINALEQKQEILLKEFDDKLKEYKSDKENSKQNMTNVEIERYKNLILKQREMMSDLTKKINEKDENIIQLQEEKELLEKMNDQQNYYISFLNKNYKSLIDLCKNILQEKEKLTSETLENHINLYKKINNEVLNKYEQKEKEKTSQNIRKYLPHNYSVDNNSKQFLNNSSLNSSMSSYINNLNSNLEEISLLTSEEKIAELKSILKEKENEIKILKIFSQKFLSNSCESSDGLINLSQIKHDFKNGFELYTKMKEIEEEKNRLKNQNEQLRDKMSEYQNNFFKMHNILSDIKSSEENNMNNKNVNELNNIVSLLINSNIDNLMKENDALNENDKNNFNQKIQDIIKEKNENLIKIANSLNNIQLIKTQTQTKKKYDEKKFINKFINSEK